MSTTRSLITGSPGRGLNSSLFLLITVDMGVIHANPFLPFIFMPSEPHTPSLHDRLYDID